MKIFYDCEFLEDGRTIDLISLGMVREDGKELYYVNADGGVMARAVQHPWLTQNVVPGLPLKVVRRDDQVVKEGATTYRPAVWWSWDVKHADFPCVLPREAIRDAVAQFVRETPQPELWAWYGAYDHVCVAQLFGSMVKLPNGFPMYTNDLKQEHMRLDCPPLPTQGKGKHNALEDARHNQVISRTLDMYLLANVGHPLFRVKGFGELAPIEPVSEIVETSVTDRPSSRRFDYPVC